MKLPIYQVDAFSSRLFGGNPAAVVVLEEWLDNEVLQAIAAENNLSETAFVVPKGRVCPLRWFTPQCEVDLCGHATLAAAHVLFRYYFPGVDQLSFSTSSGEMSVSRRDEILALNFPSRPGVQVPVDDALIAALGVRPSAAFQARDLLVIFESEEDVRHFRPDFAGIASLETFGVIISAPGSEVDFVSRFFAPRAGVPEDPVTGSAHCTLVPYWAERLGKQSLTAHQLSTRGGELCCELQGDRVLIGGATVEYLRGDILLDMKGKSS